MAQEETLVRNSVAALPTTQACLEVSFKFSALPNQSAKPESNISSVWARAYLKCCRSLDLHQAMRFSQRLPQAAVEAWFYIKHTVFKLEVTSSYNQSLTSSSMLPTMIPRHGRAGVISKPAWLYMYISAMRICATYHTPLHRISKSKSP